MRHILNCHRILVFIPWETQLHKAHMWKLKNLIQDDTQEQENCDRSIACMLASATAAALVRTHAHNARAQITHCESQMCTGHVLGSIWGSVSCANSPQRFWPMWNKNAQACVNRKRLWLLMIQPVLRTPETQLTKQALSHLFSWLEKVLMPLNLPELS